MKKLVCIVMLLCLLIPCASAETLDDFIAAYMKYASIYSAPEISSNTLMKSNGAYFWRFDSGTMIIVIRDAKMNAIPPIVGVPSLLLCHLGPISSIF